MNSEMIGTTQEQRRRGGYLREDYDVFPKHSSDRASLNNIEHANDTNQKYPNNPYAKLHEPTEVDEQLDRLEQIFA